MKGKTSGFVGQLFALAPKNCDERKEREEEMERKLDYTRSGGGEGAAFDRGTR